MKVQEFCPHCGEPIPDDAEQKFCMFCGESVDEVMIAPSDASCSSDADEPTYKIQGWQYVSAVLLFVLCLVGTVVSFWLSTANDYPLYVINILRFSPLLWAVAYGLLFLGARNKAIVTGLVIMVLFNLLQAIQYIFFPEYWEKFGLVQLVFSVLFVYAYSLFLQNCKMSAKNRTWINLLMIFNMLTVFWRTAPLWQVGDFPVTDYTNKFYFVLNILSVFAYWSFACSEAFTGPFNKDEKCNFSPLNRGMAMSLIAPAVMALALFALSKFSYVFTN